VTGDAGTISAQTRLIALLGDPVHHSLSPFIQNRAFREEGVDGIYLALRCDEADLPGVLRGVARAGGGGNITLPHKELAATALDHPTDAVRRTGACNTFWSEDGEVHGDNTDVEGLRRALHTLLDGPAEGARVLLLGAGGAARAALAALLDEGAAEVEILNRTVERARAVARRLGGERTRVLDGRGGLVDRSFDLLVNATRLGLEPDDPLPLDPGRHVQVESVLDLVYRAGETPLVRRSRELGLRAMDGGEMLVQQGAVAFERWWGRSPSVEAMRDALQQVRQEP
jgi:shikimate dehydrogenase